jgi:hypothetical protein
MRMSAHAVMRPFALLALCAGLLATAGEPDAAWIDTSVPAQARAAAAANIGFAVPPAPDSVKWFGGAAVVPSDGTVTVVQTFSMKQGGRSLLRGVKTSLPDGVRLVPIHMQDDAETAAKNMARSAPAMAVAVDLQGAWLASMGLADTPVNLVIDVNGAVRFVGLKPEAMKQALKPLLAEKADPAKRAKPRPAPRKGDGPPPHAN